MSCVLLLVVLGTLMIMAERPEVIDQSVSGGWNFGNGDKFPKRQKSSFFARFCQLSSDGGYVEIWDSNFLEKFRPSGNANMAGKSMLILKDFHHGFSHKPWGFSMGCSMARIFHNCDPSVLLKSILRRLLARLMVYAMENPNPKLG